jgi:hypothetical protein
MNKNLSLTLFAIVITIATRAQVVLNEIYTSPGGGKNEFFELYNSGTDATPLSVDGFSIVTYFEEGANRGFYVLDLPSLFISPRGFFVGSSALPFNFQGTTNSTSSNFSWNSPTLATTSGYMKKWVMTGSDASDGNISYNESSVPAGFNDFFYEKSGGSVNYSVFVFKNGILINSFYGGVGGAATQPSFITSMPDLVVNNVIAGSSYPFTIKFNSFTNNQAEYVTPAAGTDNGYIRAQDGVCNTWLKSSSTANHTPGVTNGSSAGGTGTVTITGSITRAFAPAITSAVTFDITAASSTAFPVELQVYTDNGSVPGDLDALDTYVTTVTQTSLADPYVSVSFTPANANIIIVAKTAAGCFGQVKLLTTGSNSTLPVKLVSFSGVIKNNTIKLDWTVDLNETASKFDIERSTDGTNFTRIATVNGTLSSGKEKYSFVDPVSVDKRVSYRLLMTDKDQKAEYSRIISYSLSTNPDLWISLLKNPVSDKLDINFNAKERETVVVRVVDMSGAVRFSQKVNVQSGTNAFNVPLSSSLLKGSYVMSVVHSAGMYNQMFLKN